MKSRFVALAAIASLAACSTVPFGGDIVHTHAAGAGINYSPTTGVTLGAVTASAAFVPFVAKDAKGNVVQLTTAGPCGRTDAVDVTDIQSANASANTTTTAGAPTFSATEAITQGMEVGEASRLDGMAKLQAAAGQNHSVVSEYEACPQAMPASGSGAATSTPIP